MTAITWVLAADGNRARIFETRGLTLDLQQVEDMRNPASRDRAASESERDAFARSIAGYLEQSRTQHRFDRLRLAVDARFLDVLRAHLSVETRKLVYEASGDAKVDATVDAAIAHRPPRF